MKEQRCSAFVEHLYFLPECWMSRIMRRLETNDWIILNNIIYKIHATDNFDEMRLDLLEQLRMVIDYDSADFFLASKEEGHILCSPVKYNCDMDLSEMYENQDYVRGVMDGGKALIYRETDIMSDEIRVETDYYKRVYKPNNWHYAMQFIIAKNKKFLGVITFYRTIGKENFQYDDIFVLDILKDHLAFRLEKYLLGLETSIEKLTITETIGEYGLSKREAMVLKELMSGKDSNTICEELYITSNTLKKHILNIYRKLGIKNRVQLFKMVKEKE